MFEPRSERWTESLVRRMPWAEGIACVEAWNRGVSFGMWRWCWKLGLCALVANWILETEFWVKQKRVALLLCLAKGDIADSCLWKLCVPTQEDLVRNFIAIHTSRVRIRKRWGCMQGLLSFNLVSDSHFFFCPHSLWDPSSLIRDWIHAPCSGSTAS